MSIFSILLLILPALWGLGLFVLILQRISSRLGLAPFFVLIGGLSAALQLAAPPSFQVELGEQFLSLGAGPVLLFPVLMLALLAIYSLHGTVRAREALASMLLVSVLASLAEGLHPLGIGQAGESGLLVRLAPTLTLALGGGLLVIVYQGVANLRRKASLAAGPALLAAGLAGACLLSALSAQPWRDLPAHLAGGALASLALWPLFALSLPKISPAFPDSPALAPRPAFDLFSSTQKLEARSQHHLTLFRTLAQAQRMIARAENSQALLDEICKLLATRLDYPLVWVGLLGGERLSPVATAAAGPQNGFLQDLASQGDEALWLEGGVGSALQHGEGAARLDIAHSVGAPGWKQLALRHGLRSSAAFPLRHCEHRLGVLVVYGSSPFAFSPPEIDMLQEVADGLANALINLGARRQQRVLSTSAETMQDGLIICDTNGGIIFTNSAVAKLFHQEAADLTGQNLKEILADPSDRELVEQQYEILLQEGRANFEIGHRTRTGRINYFTIRAVLSCAFPGNVRYAVVNVHDSTRRRQYERLLLALHQYTNDIVQTQSIEELLHRIFHAGEEILGAEASELYLLEEGNGAAGKRYRHHLPEAASGDASRYSEQDPRGQAIASRQPVAIGDARSDPHDSERIEFMEAAGMRALLVLPVLFQGQPIGAFSLYYRQPHDFQEDEVQLGMTLVETLAIAIQNVLLYQSERRQRQLAEALAQAAMALNSSLNLDEVLAEILNQVRTVLPCRCASLMLVEGENAQVVRYVDSSRVAPTYEGEQGERLPLTIPTLKFMMESRAPLLIADTHHSSQWYYRECSSWVRSYVGAPLIAGEQITGFINLDSDTPNFFSEETARLLQAFGSYAAAAIQNARLYSRLQSYASELEQRVSERTAELSAAKERMERILVSVPDAIFVVDQQRHPIQANPAAENLRAEAVASGQDLFSSELFSHLNPGSAPHEKAVVEVGCRAYQALASSLPMAGDGVGSVVVFRDVTRFRELDQIKSKFVSDVSHELRTPLTNLSLYIDLLTSAGTPEMRGKYLATLRRETERLADLIEGLLTISRLETGRLDVCMQSVDLERLISNLVTDRSQLAAAKDLGLSYEPQPDLPQIQTDPHLLTQVLSNLLTNAFNYTPPGGVVQVLTRTYPADCPSNGSDPACPGPHDRGGWVTIQVRDSGVGIHPDELPHLFSRFYRGAASRSTNAPGTALGLAISKEIMDRLGGRITVDSNPGQGSAFTLWLKTGDML